MKTLLAIIAIFTTFLAPIQGLLLLMIFLVFCDTSFGIYASIKIGGIDSFKSHKLFNIVTKSFFYTVTIIMAFVIDKYIFGGVIIGIAFLLPKAMAMLWSYIEIKSLDETSMKLGNRSFWVLLKELIDKLKSIKKDVNELIDDKEDKKE